MLSQVIASYQPYYLGMRSLLNFATGGILQPSSPAGTSKAVLDALIKDPTLGSPCMYKSLEAAAMVLRLARALEPRLSVNSTTANAFYTQLSELQIYFLDLNQKKSSRILTFEDKQVVVLEGFDKSGKTTVADGMRATYEDSLTLTQDHIWPDIKLICSDLHAATSAAFNCVSCYFLAKEIMEAASNQTVFVERFYHAVCAEAACAHGSVDPRALPEAAFYWPVDLPQPNLVLFLAMPKEQLDERLSQCGRQTCSENKLKLLEISYSFVSGPLIAAVDASMSLDAILSICGQIMTEHCYMNLTRRAEPLSLPMVMSAMTTQCVRANLHVEDTNDTAAPAHESITAAGISPALAEEEQIILDDVFDTENTNITNLRSASIFGNNHKGSKSVNSRRSSLGVFGAFPDIKQVDGW